MNDCEHDMLLSKWRDALNLQSWDIILKDGLSYSDMDDPNSTGECLINEVNRQAVIKIVSMNEYNKYNNHSRFIYKFEQILLHELLHIKFIFLDNSGNALQDRLVHQMIDEMATLLTNLSEEGE